uniref:Uncharacterized protein n=1 Tax=Luffa aegyptiaca TaxID=3670 RepID=A0A0K2C551_LUFAE|nr:hypothetical protein [Luffa aegyptiaca]
MGKIPAVGAQRMPVVGMGTASVAAAEERKASIVEALRAGYWHLDKA